MSISARYLVLTPSGQKLLDFRTGRAKYTLDHTAYSFGLNGKEYSVTGGAASDGVWVAPGSKVDASTLLGGTDTIYFDGRWADYTKVLDPAKGTITFTRQVGGQVESVTVANGQVSLARDNLVFADGTVRTDMARQTLTESLSGVPVLDPERTSQVPPAVSQAGSLDVVRGLAQESGVNFALPTVGLAHVLTGSGGVDQVYVTPGAIVDATTLLGGVDRIFLTGKWSDYTKTLDAARGIIVFTREVNGQAEKVSVANGQVSLARDLVIFADGAVRTDTIRKTLTNLGGGATIEDLIAEGGKTAADGADDWSDKTFSRWEIAAPEINTVAGDDVVDGGEKEAGVIVTGRADAGSTVSLIWGNSSKSVVADTDGKWSATFASGEVPPNGSTTLRATATDANGYVSTVGSRSVVVNTAPALSSDLQGISNLDVRSDLVLKSSIPVTLADGTWTIKLVNDGNAAGKLGYKGEANDNSQALIITVKDGVVTSSEGGKLTLSADGRSIILNPQHDLDLSNNYHLEIPAGMFKGSDGSPNEALNGLSFSTVTPGGYSPAGEKLGGAESQMFDSNGALVSGQNWVDISNTGSYLGAKVHIDAGGGDYAFVVKDDYVGPAEGSASGDGIRIVGNLFVQFDKWGKDDLVYFDQQDNAAPQNDLVQSAFIGGVGIGSAPLKYVGGSSGTDLYAEIHIVLEPDLPVPQNSELTHVISTIGSSTGVVISG